MPSLLDQVTRKLHPTSDSPALDAQVLLAHITEKQRSWVLAHPELSLSPKQRIKLEAALQALLQGIPLPYVLGHWEFYGLDFLVSPDVLIPRPETEELVEFGLGWLRDNKSRTVLEMGTGSGCIAIALAKNIPDLKLLAVDLSSAALDIARQNAAIHWVDDQIQFIHSDLFSNLQPATFDLITANLPYIPSETLKTLDVYTREPSLALDGGKDGLQLIRRLLLDAPQWLAPDGLILLELDSSHVQAALKLASTIFPKSVIQLKQDLAGRDRFLAVQT
ncbi:MAG: peptide chain release factor N(5)-glutamine methyltransferase [Anaerolineales bacterium]|uniref:Release factor glutamine methyltransferase n=1 Tax=Candidatus Desulfolinea nitratireducens TaxID=2841698 RepID=A0A8J6NN94_9CHLR|nr:peptide chain release factor N(5)-glutamine methyltransferase [Candidatus Desulfolinea nitratireducens]MBL6959922.1 peptide chain release factor N(5)-glutamine methyltransferase [Anaerolineales bacterium]